MKSRKYREYSGHNWDKPFEHDLHLTALVQCVHWLCNCRGHRPPAHIHNVQSVLHLRGSSSYWDQNKMNQFLLTCASWYQWFHFWGCPGAPRDFSCKIDQEWLFWSRDCHVDVQVQTWNIWGHSFTLCAGHPINSYHSPHLWYIFIIA